tara:strand:- start:3043 stop:3657 length:615 start_codon:yes stop_codon:yes gene_type:complete
MKKAAMFGLDARIALAIFGALSVISGAALYSAIQNAKLAQTSQVIVETAKAIEQFVLDTGAEPSKYDAVALNIEEILESSANGWQGPYINHKKSSATYYTTSQSSISLFKWHLYKRPNTGLGGVTNTGSLACSSKADCSLWLKSHLFTDESTAKIANAEEMVLKLDEYIDGGDGDDAGKFRVNWYGSDRTDPIIFYHVMPALSI